MVWAGSFGTMNIASSKSCSTTARRPLAPVLRSIARVAMVRKAVSVTWSGTPCSSKIFATCFRMESLGSVKMRIRCSSSKPHSGIMIGKRPTNSGISPNFMRSPGLTDFSAGVVAPRGAPATLLLPPPVLARLGASSLPADDDLLNPSVFGCRRESTSSSMPTNAPPTTNRMFCVFSSMPSAMLYFLPPLSGMVIVPPSTIFSRACCTPSPLTSRECEISLLRANLSISSMKTMPFWAPARLNLAF
mmetsp:Transcript_1737/g.6111  ORF Transcript_1737/g.6111 Transcript_1737/m.6111 type:complete len:246 (-) Transcript_1737:1529-2266(-)